MLANVTVSNEVPEQPVLSPVSHCVFERRLIEKYIAENGVDPINGQPLAEDDLIEIKSKRTSHLSSLLVVSFAHILIVQQVLLSDRDLRRQQAYQQLSSCYKTSGYENKALSIKLYTRGLFCLCHVTLGCLHVTQFYSEAAVADGEARL